MSPKIRSFFEILGRLFRHSAHEVPTNQDALGAYPLRMQISAIPERRYLRTARLLAVLTFINIGVMIALAGIFVHDALRIDVRIAGRRGANLYTMDPERKVIQNVEYGTKRVSAINLLQEQVVRDYIRARSGYYLDSQAQSKLNKTLQLYTPSEQLKEYRKAEGARLGRESSEKQTDKEVHIYSVTQTSTGVWEALIDVFDMPPYDPFKPICHCTDNSEACISCKEEHNLGRNRFRVFLRVFTRGTPPSRENPFGIAVRDYMILPQKIRPKEKFWGVPSDLRPNL